MVRSGLSATAQPHQSSAAIASHHFCRRTRSPSFTAVILALEPFRRPRACEEYDRFRRRIGLQVVVADLDSRQHPPTNLPGNVFATLGRTLGQAATGVRSGLPVSAVRRPTTERLEPGTSDTDVSLRSLALPHIPRKFTR